MKVKVAARRGGMIAVGVLAMMAAFAGGSLWTSTRSQAQATPIESESAEEQPASGDLIAAAEAALADAERGSDQNMEGPGSRRRSSTSQDSETQRIERQALEASELMCKQYGQSCELARMHRRHYDETYGGL